MTRQKKPSSPLGQLLREYREKTRDNQTRKCLTQTQVSQKLFEKFGFDVHRNVIGKWELGNKQIYPDERAILIGILALYRAYKGVSSLDEADSLMQTAGYKALTPEEIVKINPLWTPASSKETAVTDRKSVVSDAIPLGTDSVQPITINLHAVESIPISLNSTKFGPGSAPPLPSLIIGREEDLSNLKQNLGITGKPKFAIQILTAIKGWPGVGKTTIASALAHDEDVKKAFPDGVLWTSLGLEPNLLSEIATWGRALGTDELLHSKTLEESQTQLAALLRNKQMLLIIDDVWKPEHATPFNVGGRNCATLITTRQDLVANALAPAASSIYRLKVLTDQDALTLLRELAPTVVKKHPSECLVLVEELEGLPLALQVAGRLLNAEANRGFGVIELVYELRKGAKLLEAPAPADRMDLVMETTPTIAALLQKSLERLDEQTRDCYAYLGVFAPKPATFDLEAMKFVWQVEDPKPIVNTLIDYGLLEFVAEMERYQMHALLVMLAKTLLTEEDDDESAGH